MEELKQENYELKQKLQLARQMEMAYLEEIDQLKESLQTATASHSASDRPALNVTSSSEWEERAHASEEKISLMTDELRLLREQNCRLKEHLMATELRLETAESSVSMLDGNPAEMAALTDEIVRLKEELDCLETKRRLDCSQMERRLVEMDEERCALRAETSELERHLNEARNELRDVRAQLEAVELQSDTVVQNRGNSVFSEIEDRRLRAERLVQQQRQIIEGLETDLKNLKAESKRKLQEEVQKLEIRFRERDTKFTDNLVAERTRLLDENRTLTLQLQQMEDLQVENDRRAVELSKAFNFEGKSQENLIKTLEKRITNLQRRLSEKSSLVDGLRERILSANLQRRQMQTELWKQVDFCSRLSDELEGYRKSVTLDAETLGTRPPKAEIPVGRSLADETNRTCQTDRENIDPGQNRVANAESDSTDHLVSNTVLAKPQGGGPLNLRNLSSSGVQKHELPSDCKTS